VRSGAVVGRRRGVISPDVGGGGIGGGGLAVYFIIYFSVLLFIISFLFIRLGHRTDRPPPTPPTPLVR